MKKRFKINKSSRTNNYNIYKSPNEKRTRAATIFSFIKEHSKAKHDCMTAKLKELTSHIRCLIQKHDTVSKRICSRRFF